MIDCFTKTIKWEGVGGLYKGVASPLFGQMLFNAVQFLSYGQAKKFLQSDPEQDLTIKQLFIAGAITGFAVSFVEGPVDLLKSQMQVQIFNEKAGSGPKLYTSVFDCGKKIVTNHGVRGLYQGLGATIIRDIPAVSCYFGVYELCRRWFAGPNGDVNKLSASHLLISGGVGGLLYWVFTYPIDVVKSSMQGDSTIKSQRKYSSIIDCAQKLYAQGGVRTFFRGITPCLLRAFPANAACFFAYEKTRQFLG